MIPLEQTIGVLVIEDESIIAGYVRLILENAGYCVFLAGNESELKEVWKAHHNEIHLVISDVVLPWLSGPELVRELRRDRYQLAIILMSGLLPEPGNELLELIGNYQFLEKPFTPSMMIDTVRSAIENQLSRSSQRELETANQV
jgi:two-component system, cell cycle sensor histidine kinase and response regulator CckA